MYVRSTKLEKTSLSFTNGLALNSSVALRLILIKLLSANGDGEIRTLDPLLARQVLSQLSYTPMFCNQLFSILITCLHAIMPSMIPMHVTPLKRCGSSFLFFKKQSLYSFV